MAHRKEAAHLFLRLAASGKVREIAREHLAPDFRHHNPHFRGDAESLIRGMEENAAQNPNKVIEVQRTLEEGDLVAVHSRLQLKPGGPTFALVHIFKFREEVIAELWDLAQPVPDDSPNANGMF